MRVNSPSRQAGLTLLELAVTLLILAMLTAVAVRSTADLQNEARYRQTEERLDMIREAILGDPRKTANGQAVISGFVADMGRLPGSLHELLEQAFCSDRTYQTQADCTAHSGVWFAAPSWQQDSASGLWFGWRGPYLRTTQKPNDADAFTDGWGREAQTSTEHNSGWGMCSWNTAFSPCDNGTNNLTVYSFGSDGTNGGSGYAADYPEALDQATIFQRDYTAELDGGITVYLKGRRFNLDSHCSNAVYTTRSTCTSNGGEWFGGCSEGKAGSPSYANKSTCEAAGKTWSQCSIAGHSSQTDCETAGGAWYGEGFGCDDESKLNKTDCGASWRACSDKSQTTHAACEGTSPRSNWFGNGEDSDVRLLCMKLYHRLNGAVTTLTATSTPQIVEDGMAHSILFTIPAGQTVTAGQAAMGIYYQRGTECRGEQPYPLDKAVVSVTFIPRTTPPVIAW